MRKVRRRGTLVHFAQWKIKGLTPSDWAVSCNDESGRARRSHFVSIVGQKELGFRRPRPHHLDCCLSSRLRVNVPVMQGKRKLEEVQGEQCTNAWT